MCVRVHACVLRDKGLFDGDCIKLNNTRSSEKHLMAEKEKGRWRESSREWEGEMEGEGGGDIDREGGCEEKGERERLRGEDSIWYI